MFAPLNGLVGLFGDLGVHHNCDLDVFAKRRGSPLDFWGILIHDYLFGVNLRTLQSTLTAKGTLICR
jgi:hypothetical protein